MSSFTRYCKSYNFGHRWLKEYFSEPVDVEEKVDGSQFSFMLDEEGQLHFRSRNRVFTEFDSHDLFQNTVDHIISVRDKLVAGWTYRGEAMKGPKHNVQAYERAPAGHLVLFDVATDDSKYLPHESVFTEAHRLGLEPVPLLDSGVKVGSLDAAKAYLETESVLGGVPVEGVVFKRRHRPLFNDRDNMILAKLVSERFREKAKIDYQSESKTKKALLAVLLEQYCTKARWDKAIQHLREAGALTNEPKDIGPLIQEIQRDTLEDHEQDIKELLFRTIRKPFERGLVKDFPQYYKELLMESQFDQ